MQTIVTKRLNPTDTKGSRISAKCEAGRLIVTYDHSKGLTENHRAAAVELANKLGWDYFLVSGSDGERGYHTPVYDTMAASGHRNSRIYRAAECQRVLDSLGEDGIATLKVAADEGKATRYLNVDRRVVGALVALFNAHDID